MLYNPRPKIVLVTAIPPVHASLSEYGKFLVEGLLAATPNSDLHVLADVTVQAVTEMSRSRRLQAVVSAPELEQAQTLILRRD